ncbi:MAG: creatininase family protein [Fusobacteria bacterium]|nr:creatininase family protein [Fusobacteriota bacterium]
MNNELHYLTGNKYKNKKFDKVIFAIGSCENHGEHLPFGTDTFVSHILAQKVAMQVDGLLVLPPINIGYSGHYADFAFSLSLKSETLIAVIKDMIESVISNGISKIFVMNGHDGNIAPIEIATREMKVKYPEVKIATLDAWWVAVGKLIPRGTFEAWNGLGHAGEGETSMALQLFEELVQMEYAKGVVPDNLVDHIDIKWLFNELTNCGVTGDPTKATKEKGCLMEEALLKLLVDFFKKMDANNWNYSSTVTLS